jgi:trimeric autotransporter adhesin
MPATALLDRLPALTLARLAGLLSLACATSALATTWTVDSTSADPGVNACTAAAGDCSFPGAVSRLASVGDSIVFTVTSSLATEVAIAKDVTIDAAGASLPKLRISTSVGWATVTVRNARWQNLNSTVFSGGALSIARQQIVTIEDSEFLYNRSVDKGGAIYNEGTLVVTRSRFEGNYSINGAGAIHSTNFGSLTVLDSTFRANGVLNPAGPGRQLGQFGAVSAENTLDIRGCLFYENESNYAAAVRGGALSRIYNSTFSGNKTFQATEGGALLLGGPTRIANSSIVGNSGVTSGGLYVYPSSDTQVINTLIANNTGASPEISGRVYSLGNNLIRDRTGAQVEGNIAGTDIYSTDPRLAPLANYGGLTLTLALQPESPALNAGSNCVQSVGGCGDFPHVALSNDQRGAGFPRLRAGTVDIGAFELGSVVVSNDQDSGAGSLRQAISDALVGDVISFSPDFFNQPRTIALASTLVVNKSMSIVGPGASLLTLDANNQRRHLNVDAPATLNLRGMRFTRGNPGPGVSGGAILVNLGTLSASEITIDSSTGNVGGCIYNNGTLNLALARLSGCQANVAAGVFNEVGKTATISDTRIENNVATGPGGGIGNPGTLELTRVSLSGNQATIGGGLNSYGTATLSNTTVSGNTADNGGGMYLGGTGTTTLTHATVTANSAQYNGGVGAEFDAVVNLSGALIAGNTRTIDQAPDAGGNFTSFGYNLIGSTIGTTFRPSSPSLVGNLTGAPAQLAPLADNGGYSLTHAPLYNSQAIDAGGPGLATDGRGLARPIDFSNLANASGGDGSDIGAFELQVSTPTNVVAAPAAGGLSVSFNGGANGGLAISSYRVVCGAQSATGSASPILVSGLAAGVAVTCAVTASSGALIGIPSAPSNSVAPAVPPGAPTIGTAVAGNGQVSVVFSAPASDGGSPISSYTATCGSRSASASASPISVIGLINGAATNCSVKASNAVGSGPASASSNSVIPGLPGAYAYVAKGGTDAAVIDLADNTVVATIPLVSSQTGVAASPDGSRVYLVSQGTDDVTVINTQSNTVVTRIPVPNRPWSAVVSPDSSLIYVTQSSGNEISVISAASNTVVSTIPNIQSGYGIAITPDGKRLYVAPAGGSFIYTVDTTTYATDTVGVGNYPIDVAVSPDGTRAYVTALIGNNVTVIENTTAGAFAVATIPVGSTPHGVTVSPDGARVYVANSNSNSVSVIDAQSLSVIATVPVGAQPRGVDVSPDSSRAYVINQGNANVSVIDAASNTVTVSIAVGGGGAMYSMGNFMAVGGVAPTITSAIPADGSFLVPYSQAIVATGNPAPSFGLISGVLPPGLSLDPATGVISGIPVAPGTWPTVVLRASNGVGTPATQTFSITIAATLPNAPTIIDISAGDGSVSVSFVPPANDGGSPITMYNAYCGGFAASSPTSPITINGLPNGVPVTCTVNAVNAIGGGVASAPSAPVTPGVAPAFTSTTLPAGTYGTPYQQTLTATGSPAPTYALASGTLPTGLGLNASSGLISGTPSSVGSFSGSISASNGVGAAATQAFVIVIAAALPGAPSIVGVTRGDGQVTVDFSAPGNTGGVTLSGYTAQCGGQIQSGPTAPVTVTGLSNGTPVTCTVYASNSAGNGPPSAASSPVTPATVPDAPTISGISAGDGSVTVSFAPPANNGGAAITLYNAFCGGFAASSPTSPITINGLPNGVPVTCTVNAVNAIGGGVASAPSAPVTPGVAPAFTSTTLPAGTYGTPYQQTLIATGSPAPTYALASGTLPTGLGLNASSGLISGTPSSVGSFSGSISASNGIGTAATQVFAINIAAGLPAAPTAVVATSGNSEVSVAFVAPFNTGGVALSGYSASCGGQSANGSGSPITVTGLFNGTAVTCTVVAHNSAGSSPPSSPSNSVTPATVPGAPVIASVTPGNGSATLSFTPPASNGGASVIDYTASCAPGTATSIGAASPLTISGLSNGVLYQCSVRARNAVGSGAVSAAISVIPAAVLSADLAVTVTNNSSYVTGGATTTYLIRVSNPGPAGVANARVDDALGTEFSGASWTCSGQNGGQCDPSGSGDIDQRVDLPVGSTVTFALTALVAATPETAISTIASVTPPPAIDDPMLTNNVGSDGPDIRGLFRNGFE